MIERDTTVWQEFALALKDVVADARSVLCESDYAEFVSLMVELASAESRRVNAWRWDRERRSWEEQP